MPNKLVSLLKPGRSGSDPTAVRFNAVAIATSNEGELSEGELTTFVLEVEEALHLGQWLTQAAEEERRKRRP
jgi:hypothetical protein